MAVEEPQVIIPNYVLSMSNCAETSDFYSVCCLDHCEAVLDKLERSVKGPTATVEQIVNTLSGFTTMSLDEPRNLAPGSKLRNMLEEVASNSGWSGINLHGRLLAQWLHYAFPHDCPYPAKGGSLNPLTANAWQEQAVEKGEDAIDYKRKTDKQQLESDEND